MNLERVEKAKDCFDGNSVYNYFFDSQIDKQFIIDLADLGTLEYFPDFPRPFYRLQGFDGFQIKGVEGENNWQIIFPRENLEKIKNRLNKRFKNQ